jgi:hypothetical protein
MDDNKTNKYISVSYESNQDDIVNPSLGKHIFLLILVVFPLNHPNLNILNDQQQNRFILCQNREKKRKEDKLLLGESSKIIYEAKTKMNKNLSDYVVGIFSKKKREMTFVDIDGIFSINHKIRKIEEHSQKMEELERHKLLSIGADTADLSAPSTSASGNYIDKKLQLIKDFGTSKAKKAASSIKAHMVNENNISSVNAVKRMLEDTAIKQNLNVQLNEEQKQLNKISLWRDILPEFDINAEDKKNIFILESSKLNFYF